MVETGTATPDHCSATRGICRKKAPEQIATHAVDLGMEANDGLSVRRRPFIDPAISSEGDALQRVGKTASCRRSPQTPQPANPDPQRQTEEKVMSSMSDKIKGVANQAAGKTKEALGKATDDRDLRAQGKAQDAKGKAQQAAGKAKDAVKKVIDDV
jgi:uncharacterized protein YjbJ (UPF0337 family)